MHNVSHEVANGELVIRVKIDASTLAAAPPSSSGKTRLVGSTGGPLAIAVPGATVTFSLNVMNKA